MSILAIDAGTTGVTALVVTADGRIAARGYQEFRQHFPRPGWVEHAPEEIWQATLESVRDCLAVWDGDRSDLKGVGITNLVPYATARADELTKADLLAGRQRLEGFVREHTPRVVAILGITAYRQAFGRPRATPGRQPEPIGEPDRPGPGLLGHR